MNEEATFKINEALVLKYVGQEEPLRLTLMDYGGQKVFLSLHRMFLKRRSVFVLVFNMMWLLDSGDKDKREETFEMLGGCRLSSLFIWTLSFSKMHSDTCQSVSDCLCVCVFDCDRLLVQVCGAARMRCC